MQDRQSQGLSLSEQVYDRLLQEIIDGTYPIATRLPSEDALAKACGVSRPVLRQALAQLRNDGIVATRQGSGNFVQRRPESSVSSIVPLSSISDIQRCYEFRMDFEPNLARLAAMRRTDEQLEKLAAAIAHFNRTYQMQETGTEADMEIHLAIARSTGNPFHLAALESIASQIVFGMNLSRSLTLRASPLRNDLVEAEHQEIFNAIKAQDPDRAHDAMLKHLQGARERMFVGGN